MKDDIITRCNGCKKLVQVKFREFLDFKAENEQVRILCTECAKKTARLAGCMAVLVGFVALLPSKHKVRERDLIKYKKCNLINLRKKELHQIELDFYDEIKNLSTLFRVPASQADSICKIFRDYKIKTYRMYNHE